MSEVGSELSTETVSFESPLKVGRENVLIRCPIDVIVEKSASEDVIVDIMSSFFDFQRPKMFDVKKKLGLVDQKESENSAESSAHGNGSESWVELAPSRGSLCSSVDATMVMVDDHATTKDSRLSPVSVQSPHIEFESLEQVKYKLVRDMLPPGKNTDWIWDWSSRPEALPPKCVRMRQYGSNLTTPPNSPEPDLLAAFPIDRKDRKKDVISMNIFVGFIVSNLVTLVLGAAIGFAVCRRIAKQREV